jgi:sec-independent protein translocase protein TatA
MLPNIGIWELLVILLIVILIFGARKLPEIGRGLGEGIANFKKSIKDGSKKDDTSSAPPAKEK